MATNHRSLPFKRFRRAAVTFLCAGGRKEKYSESILLHESNMTHRPRLAPPSSSTGARDSLAEMIFRRYATVITSAELLETLG